MKRNLEQSREKFFGNLTVIVGNMLFSEKEMSISTETESLSDPLLILAGSGKEIWSDEHADEYVRRLREGWDEAVHLWREMITSPPDPRP